MALVSFVAILYALYLLIFLFRASRRYGGFAAIPSSAMTLASARFGIFLGMVLTIKGAAIFLSAPAAPHEGWFLGGVLTKAFLVAAFGLYILFISWRYAKRS